MVSELRDRSMAMLGDSWPIRGAKLIFDGEDYDYWSFMMKTLLVSQDLWDLVENVHIEDQDVVESLDRSSDKKLKENKKRDLKALFIIQQSISRKFFPRIIGVDTSKEACDILQKEFEGSDKMKTVKLLTLKQEFQNLRMKEKEILQVYFSRVIEVVNQIKCIGDDLTDKTVWEKVLISLSPKYDNMVTIIEEMKELSSLSIHNLMGSLEMHEQWMKRHTKASLKSAFQSKVSVKEDSTKSSNKRQYSRGGGSYGRGRGHG
ncbi:uncharacterized protein LOC124935284 [Impatiens glandulifera]|uniref:uncharacterized protein LOC124935284 n=1 Tax=Impatiens glandulifera TaxID=253017 RepID=UPI001FB14D25|nr:uncharacterized protein LOC124935284 [Impatiens glandulifera]